MDTPSTGLIGFAIVEALRMLAVAASLDQSHTGPWHSAGTIVRLNAQTQGGRVGETEVGANGRRGPWVSILLETD
jgi:hypothetical protein